MMDLTKHINNSDTLITAIRQLISGYKKTEELIDRQITSVVKSNVDELTDFADQQTRINQELEDLEMTFRNEMDTLFAQLAPNEQQRKLSFLIPHLPTKQKEVDALRQTLISSITNAKNKQAQLLNLLEFAQQHTTETLRAIHAMSNNTSKRYTVNGKAATEHRSFAINQTA